MSKIRTIPTGTEKALSPDERLLLDGYRAASEERRETLLLIAENALKGQEPQVIQFTQVTR